MENVTVTTDSAGLEDSADSSGTESSGTKTTGTINVSKEEKLGEKLNTLIGMIENEEELFVTPRKRWKTIGNAGDGSEKMDDI